MKIPLLSIIVPVWNTSSVYLDECFRPFIENDCPEIELIVVDDGSDEKTASYLDSLHFSVSAKVLHQRNRGQNAARMCGIKQANGKYIGFLDSDDKIIWGSFIDLISQLKFKNDDIILFSGVQIDETGNSAEKYIGPVLYQYSKREYIRNCAELWIQFFRKDFLMSQGLFVPSQMYIGEDLASVLPLIIRAKKISVFDGLVYQYRQQNSSVMHSLNPIGRMSIVESFEYIINTLSPEDLNTFHEEIEWQAVNHLLFYETCAQLKFGFAGLAQVYMLRKWVKKHFPNWNKNYYLNLKKEKHSYAFNLAIKRHFFIIMFYECILKRFSLKQKERFE